MADLTKPPGPGLAVVTPAAAFLAGFSGEALRTMAGSIRAVVGLFEEASGVAPGTFDPGSIPWRSFERAHVKRIREMLSERFAPATAKRHFSALRGVLAEAGNTAATGIRGPKGSSEDAGRALTREEIARLVEACDATTFRGAQLRAMLATGLYAGLRRFEIAGLDVGDFKPVSGELVVRRGKGREARTIVLAPAARAMLNVWILFRGEEPGPLFYGHGRSRVHPSTVALRFTTLGESAGIDFSPHDLRRTFVTRVLEVTGGDLGTAQRLAGHKQIETTKRYDKRGRESADRISSTLTFEPEPEK